MTQEEKLLRLEAAIYTLTAELGAAVCLVEQVTQAAQSQGLEMPDVPSTFLHYRKQLFHQSMEHLEKTQPGHAARIQQIVDDHHTELPLKYD